MKIRLLANPPKVPLESVLERMSRCCELIDEYLRGRATGCDPSALLSTRLEISLFVPPGVYSLGGDVSNEMYAVFGVHETGKFSGRAEAFDVPHTRIHGHGEFAGGWIRTPLVGTEGFLVPVSRDEYRGERFIRMGELLNV